MISKVTITGADDSIDHAALFEISKEFPFVEWGILLSRSQKGNNRFPSLNWLKLLVLLTEKQGPLNLSGHLCGAWVRELTKGDTEFLHELPSRLWALFQRVQINTHAELHRPEDGFYHALQSMSLDKEWIFQYDKVNTDLLLEARNFDINYSTLFDLSHGAGVLPDKWPTPLPGIRCGYAGGLSPDNLEEQIERIETLVGSTEIWIDVETHVRSNNDRLFDLDKVRKFLTIAEDYVTQPNN